MTRMRNIIGAAVLGALFCAEMAAYAQIPGQGGSPPVNALPMSFAGPVAYSSGGGGSATFPSVNVNGTFRFKTSTTASTNAAFLFGGGGYPGNASPYIPACVASLETVGAGAITSVVPTNVGVTVTWTTSVASVTGDVHCN